MNYKRKLHVSTIFKNKITAESVKLAHHRKGTPIKFNTLPPYNKNDKIAITRVKKTKTKKSREKKFFCSLSFPSSTIVFAIVIIKKCVL